MNLIGLHFKIRRAVLDFFNLPSKEDRDILSWFDNLSIDKQEIVSSRILIFSIGGFSAGELREYIREMMAGGLHVSSR